MRLVDDWIEAYNYVGSILVKDETKTKFWANSNSSNSQGDRTRKDNEWQRSKNKRVIIMTLTTKIHRGIVAHGITRPEVKGVIIIWEIKTHPAIGRNS